MKGMLFFVAVSQIIVLCTFRDYFGEFEKMILLLRILSSFSEPLPTYLSYYYPTTVLRHFSQCSTHFTVLVRMGAACWKQFVR